MSLGKIVIQNQVYLINTDVSLPAQENTINKLLAQFPPHTKWEWFDKCSINDVIQSSRLYKKYNIMKYWRIWAKALGEKATDNADSVAFVRTLLIAQAIITNILISINIILNWL